MTSFFTRPLEVPYIAHPMTELIQFLEKQSYEIICFPEAPNTHSVSTFIYTLVGITKPITIKFYSRNSNFVVPVNLANQNFGDALKRLSCNAEKDFQLLAESLSTSLEIGYGSILLSHKPIYLSLISEALKHFYLVSKNHIEVKPETVYVASNDLDFLAVVSRVMLALIKGKAVSILCSSVQLMLPVYIFSHILHDASGYQGIVRFFPLKPLLVSQNPPSSTQIILRPCDLDSAVRMIVKASSHDAGLTSWRPSIILVEQDYEVEFRSRVNKMLTPVDIVEDNLMLDENSHVRSFCYIPKFIKSEFDTFVGDAGKDGADIVRPSAELGPVFVFGLTPASEMLEKHKRLPLGPCSIVLPFRTGNEAIKLANYFKDREQSMLGSGDYMYELPKSATIWTENSSLTWQVLAKLATYETLAVNSDAFNLRSAYFLSNNFNQGKLSFSALRLPTDDNNIVSSSCSAEIMKLHSLSAAVSTIWKKVSFEQRISALSAIKDFTEYQPSLNQLRVDCLSSLNPLIQPCFCEEVCLGRPLTLRKCRAAPWPVIFLLRSDELRVEEKKLLLCSLAAGSSVAILVPKDLTLQPSVSDFCSVINKAVSDSNPAIVKTAPLIQLNQLNASELEIYCILSTLPTFGLCLVSCKDDDCAAEVNISHICRPLSMHWSVGGNLFAN